MAEAEKRSPTFKDFNPTQDARVTDIKERVDDLIAAVRQHAEGSPEGQRRMALACTHFETGRYVGGEGLLRIMPLKDPEQKREASCRAMRVWRAADLERARERWRKDSARYRRRRREALKLAQRRAAGSADPGAATDASSIYAD